MNESNPGVAVVAAPTMGQKITDLLERYPVILQLMRFAAIGVINTALDFLVLNAVSKSLGVTEGVRLGQVNIIGFSLAVVQSYYWNKYWAFSSEQGVSLIKNFTRLMSIGALGALAMGLVLLGAKITAPSIFYLIILAVFIISQFVLWNVFGFEKPVASQAQRSQFITFLVVSIIGLAVNSAIIALLTSQVQFTDNLDLNKNIAKIVATLASLVWNFVGYKLFVFKK